MRSNEERSEVNKPKQVAEADILALIGSLTNVAYTEATHEGIEYEVYEADRVDVPSLRSLPCVQDATLREKSVIISLRPAYRDSLTIPHHELPTIYRWVLLVLIGIIILVAFAAAWIARHPIF
ncbi:hypothetical protein ACU6QD_12210 [Corynebacterium glucuronolyticum]